ncbi:MAG TPA: DUF2007 domain-containing protein [Anaeromyxobacter sp.]|nr:DUF2007 domain-containing protein [Anaeromyxobacter sp.]
MDPSLDKKLVASFANRTEALAARTVLEDEGIPCELADLEQLPGDVIFGTGALGRSAGIWVLAADAERASALVAELLGSAGVDEAAIVTEASASEPEAAGREPSAAPEEGTSSMPLFALALLAGAGLLLLAIVCG